MGRPYATEIENLRETYSWALNVSIEPAIAGLSASASLPLLAVGSGGSFTAAHFACALHQTYTGMVSRPVTPLDLVSTQFDLRSLAVMILTAGGSNADIVSSFRDAVAREPRRCMVLCLRKGSTLSHLAHSYRFVDLLDFSPPSIKDGFLATNSLLAFLVLLVRAYAHAFSSDIILPNELEALLSFNSGTQSMDDLLASCTPLWKRDTLVVLYGPSVSSAALDLESKFSEAALGNIQLADFRNFAHGRHHWLAKRGSKTGVLAIFSNDERALAERTLHLIPASIPIARVCVPGVGPIACVSALVAVLHLVGAAGRQHGIDPGRPGVPEFGRKIYGLRVSHRVTDLVASPEMTAVARKLGCDVRALGESQTVLFWRDAYRRFSESLERASFSAILFDYDGTLCDEQDRFSGLCDDVLRHLNRLLKAGILIGIATGRGKSVREALRRGLPEALWQNVYLGYYNGSDLANLYDDMHPNSSAQPAGALKAAVKDISEHPAISKLATWEPRRTQVSVQQNSGAFSDLIWRVVHQLAQVHGLQTVRSSHSVDVIQHGVSKRSLLHDLQNRVPSGTDVLLIGDKGEWPGNDYDLLSAPYSLSVDEVSADLNSCWNLAPAGHRGVQATIDYMGAFQLVNRTVRIDMQLLSSLKFSRRAGR